MATGAVTFSSAMSGACECAFAPDSSLFAFSDGNGQASVVSVTGGSPTVLGKGDEIAFAPDSGHVAYRAFSATNAQSLAVQSTTGSAAVTISTTSTGGQFTADSKYIVFVSMTSAEPSFTLETSPIGGGAVALPYTGLVVSAQLSADGAYIVYVGDNGLEQSSADGSTSLVLDPSGGAFSVVGDRVVWKGNGALKTALLSSPAAVMTLDHNTGHFTVSSDGTYVVFEAGAGDLRYASTTTGEVTPLFPGDLITGNPNTAWSDARHLIATRELVSVNPPYSFQAGTYLIELP
jgi:hypothetical protein